MHAHTPQYMHNMSKTMSGFISFFYCSQSGVQVVSPSRRWYRPPILPIIKSKSQTTFSKIVTTPLVW